MFRRIRERFRRWTQKKPKEDPEEEAMKEELEKVARKMEKCKVMQKKLVEERDLLVKTVAELNALLASEQKQREQDMKKRDARHQQNISELQASLKLGEEREKTAEMERENLMKDRERLEKRVAQLEATLASERKKQEEEREKVKQDMEERNARHQQNITELQASLKLCEEQEKTAELARESLRHQEHLERNVAQLEATLDSKRKKRKRNRKKAKLDVEARNSTHLPNITELQASLKPGEEQEKAELKSKTEQLERLRAIEKMCRARAPEPGTIEVQARCLQEEQQAVLGQTPGERVLTCQ